MSGSANVGTTAERHICELWGFRIDGFARFSNARVRRSVFSLDNRLTWTSANRKVDRRGFALGWVTAQLTVARDSLTIAIHKPE